MNTIEGEYTLVEVTTRPMPTYDDPSPEMMSAAMTKRLKKEYAVDRRGQVIDGTA